MILWILICRRLSPYTGVCISQTSCYWSSQIYCIENIILVSVLWKIRQNKMEYSPADFLIRSPKVPCLGACNVFANSSNSPGAALIWPMKQMLVSKIAKITNFIFTILLIVPITKRKLMLSTHFHSLYKHLQIKDFFNYPLISEIIL